MYSIAMVIDGCVYGVLLVEGTEVKRAWIDPELDPGTICVKMEFRSDDLNEVMAATQKVLDVRPIPEVDPKDYHFDLAMNAGCWSRKPSLN